MLSSGRGEEGSATLNVQNWAPKLHDPEFAREAAQMVADIYNRWKVKLPPKPANPA